MLTQKVSTIDELLQFVSTLRQKHGVRLWFRGEENADLTLIPSIQRSQKRLDSERYIANDFRIARPASTQWRHRRPYRRSYR